MIKQILKTLGWIAAGIAALVIAAYLILIAINWRDKDPSPAAIRFANLYRDRPAVAPADNGFIYVMGFNVTPGKSPRQMGSRRVAWLEASTGGTRLNPDKDTLGKQHYEKPVRIPAVQELLDACKFNDSKCAAALDAGNEVFERWMTSESELLERYRALIAHSGWRETAFDANAPLPAYARVMDGQKFLLLNASVLAGKGDYRGVRDLLQSDLRFWRMVLESSDNLISKMIATRAITRHFELGNLVLRKFSLGTGSQAVPAEWRATVSDSERSMRRCLVGEWVFSSEVLRDSMFKPLGKEPDSVIYRARNVLLKPLYQQQDVINEYAERYSRIAELLEVPFGRYEAAANQVTEMAKPRKTKLSAYNIVGQPLLNIQADFGSYARRVGDIEGVRLAALAAVAFRDAGIQVSDVATVLAASPLRNPYNDQAFEWNERRGTIVFRGLEPGSRGEHRIKF